MLLSAVLATSGCSASFWVPPAPSPDDIPRLEARLAREPEASHVRLRLGASYHAAGRLDEARSTLEQVYAAAPEEPAVLWFLGLTYEDLGLYSEARGVYERYIASGRFPGLRDELRRRLALIDRRQLEAAVRAALTREAELAATPPERGTVAVFPFVFAGGDLELTPLSRALPELLVTDLSVTDRLRVLERFHVQALVQELRLAEEGYVDPSTAVRSGFLLGAGQIVQGTLAGGDDLLMLQAAVVEATGEVAPDADSPGAPRLVSISESDQLARFFDMQKRLAFQVYEALGIALTPAERELVERRPTQNLRALLLFGLGLEAEDAGDYVLAADYFAAAAAEDPGFREAAERRGAADRMGLASIPSPQELARDGMLELAQAQRAAEPHPALVPPLPERDAAAEVTGQEGLSRVGAIEIIIRRP